MKRRLEMNNYVIPLLLTLMIGTMVFMNSLVDLTLAWFSTDMRVNNQSIVAANFDIEVSIYSMPDTILIEKKNEKYILESGTYKVSLKRIGSAKNSSGYSSLKIGDKNYISDSIEKNEVLEFTLVIDNKMDIDFTSIWGVAPTNGENIIKNNDVISILTNVKPTEPVETLNNDNMNVSQNETVNDSAVESTEEIEEKPENQNESQNVEKTYTKITTTKDDIPDLE